jgi:hypothetical protein
VQSHEIRGTDATSFYDGDIAERPLVIFDKSNIITFRTRDDLNIEQIKKAFSDAKNRILQESRVKKYINRGQYLEAYLKYLENIANPLVTIARLIYTPNHYDYELCHISNHLPKETVEQLEKLYQVKSFDDISENLTMARSLLVDFEEQFKEKYGVASN